MRLINRKGHLQRIVEAVGDSLETARPGGGADRRWQARLPTVRGHKPGWPQKDKAVKAGMIAGGLAGLTAGSAGVSSLRRRREGARGDS